MEPYAWRRVYSFCIRQPTSQYPVGSFLLIPKSPQYIATRNSGAIARISFECVGNSWSVFRFLNIVMTYVGR